MEHRRSCDPLDVTGIADIAAHALSQTPEVRTYVIGVFGPNDTGRANLDAWAKPAQRRCFRQWIPPWT